MTRTLTQSGKSLNCLSFKQVNSVLTSTITTESPSQLQIWRDFWAMDPEVFDAKVQSAKIYNTYLTREQKSEKEFDLLAMAQMKFQASQRDPPLNFGELIYRLGELSKQRLVYGVREQC